ncbi:MAG: SUMF1/EgtB/PvdO family nonheme iron enzyme [Pirellulales bacterium]
MLRYYLSLTVLSARILLAPVTAQAVVIDTVLVGNPGNAPTTLAGVGQMGAVDYYYRMGTFEITNAQYVEFLNAKAASDPLQLWDKGGEQVATTGISRSGASGSYDYAPLPDMADKPVNNVTFFDAVRFVNWLHNDQGIGDTETGSYTLLGGTPIPSNANTLARNPNATWVLPTEDEWVKSAYFDARNASAGGPPGDDHYWTYPTASDAVPTKGTADSAGNISNPGANVANYGGGANWNGPPGVELTTVGSAGPLSTSHYGTYDQAGNAMEWSTSTLGTAPRVVLGGSYLAVFTAPTLTIEGHSVAEIADVQPGTFDPMVGFRVVYLPEPSTFALAALAVAGAIVIGRARRGTPGSS